MLSPNSNGVADQVNEYLSQIGLFSAPRDLASLDDMVIAPQLRERLTRVVLEQSKRVELLARRLRPARKLLFSGPAGCGKTMSAGAIARAVGLPMFRVELHGVVSQYFGETAKRLAKVFDHVRSMRALYLFDEFDAFGAERGGLGGESDGGEMRRVVSSLLQFIESDQSDSMIVAATNHVQMLDSALWRRFDEVIVFRPVTRDEIVELVRRNLVGYVHEPIDHDALLAVHPRLGHADLCAALDRARKDHVIAGVVIDTKCLVDGIERRMRDTYLEDVA